MRTFGYFSILLACASVPSAPAVAQDAGGGVFDMGQLTGSLAMDHITQSERARARGHRSRPTSRQVAACSKKQRFRAEYGANNAKVRRLYSLCRSAGL